MATSILSVMVLSLLIFATVASCASGISFPSLLDATREDVRAGLQSGLFTSVDLTKAYLARIGEVNEEVHAITEVNPDALEIAAALDAERANGTVRSALHGIPILLKDNIATADKMNNTSGSLALLGAKVPRDATVSQKLRDAGAILLGKANLSQWANMRSRTSSNGWAAYGGQVTAAYHPKQDPDGSSSGSAVAVDIGLAVAAIGTETDGSVTMPAHRSGIVGIKPTVGLVSRDLVIPISERQDTVGPMAKTVRGAAQVLQIIAGGDPRDNYTSVAPPGSPDYVAACDVNAIRGMRIGVPWNAINLKLGEEGGLEVELETFMDTIDVLKAAGAWVVDANFTMAEETLRTDGEDVVLNADFLVNLADYLSQLSSNPNDVHTLAEMRRFTQKSAGEQWPCYDTSVWDEAIDEQGWNNTDPRLWPVYQRNLHLSGPGGLLGALDRHSLDAVAMPTSASKKWAAMSGAPIVSVPMGFHPRDAPLVMSPRGDLVRIGPRVPFGLAFMGRKWDEERLISLAYGYEQRSRVRGRVKPWVKPRAEIGG